MFAVVVVFAEGEEVADDIVVADVVEEDVGQYVAAEVEKVVAAEVEEVAENDGELDEIVADVVLESLAKFDKQFHLCTKEKILKIKG